MTTNFTSLAQMARQSALVFGPAAAQRAFGTSSYTVPAADALTAVWVQIGLELETAGPSTGPAVYALFLVRLVSIKRYGVEYAVYGPQRAEVPAERPVTPHGEQEDDNKQPQLPVEQPAERALQPLVHKYQRYTGE